jgi:hypothetical protein
MHRFLAGLYEWLNYHYPSPYAANYQMRMAPVLATAGLKSLRKGRRLSGYLAD